MSEVKSTVPDIKKGTVIDHIQPGCGIKIAKFLQLLHGSSKIVLCLNLDSKLLGKKDLIKVSPTLLPKKTLDQIAVFSPTASVNWIEGSEVVTKELVTVPSRVHKIFICPNDRCVSNPEMGHSSFNVSKYKHEIDLECIYCLKKYSLDELKHGTAS